MTMSVEGRAIAAKVAEFMTNPSLIKTRSGVVHLADSRELAGVTYCTGDQPAGALLVVGKPEDVTCRRCLARMKTG